MGAGKAGVEIGEGPVREKVVEVERVKSGAGGNWGSGVRGKAVGKRSGKAEGGDWGGLGYRPCCMRKRRGSGAGSGERRGEPRCMKIRGCPSGSAPWKASAGGKD